MLNFLDQSERFFSQTAAIAAIITLCMVGCPFILFAVGFYFRIARAKVNFHQIDLETIERGAIARGLFTNHPTESYVDYTERIKSSNMLIRSRLFVIQFLVSSSTASFKAFLTCRS